MSIILFSVGFIEDVQAWDPTEGASFWILSALVGIPGFYVLKKLREAWKAPPGSEERRLKLRDLPEMQ